MSGSGSTSPGIPDPPFDPPPAGGPSPPAAPDERLPPPPGPASAAVRQPTHVPPHERIVARADDAVGRRIVAGFLDVALMTLLAAAIGERSANGLRAGFNLEGLDLLWWILAVLAYWMVAELLTGTSPGKAVMGLCVRDDVGGAPMPGEFVVRNLLRVVDAFPALYLLGFVMMLFSPRRQRIGDRTAGTVVLRRVHADVPPLRPRSIVVLASIVGVVVLASIALLAQPGDRETLGRFDVEDEVLPYAVGVTEDVLSTLSADVLRDQSVAGIATEAELQEFIGFLVQNDWRLADGGGVTVARHARASYALPTGGRAEAIDVEIDVTTEVGPGTVVVTVIDEDGTLRVLGFNAGL